MINSIVLCLKHRGRINGKKKITFMPGVNVIIGPNGSGKSSLLTAIYSCPDCQREETVENTYHYFNSETMNPHRNEEHFFGVEGSLIRVRAMFSSHGETMRDVLAFTPLRPDGCLLLDEPECGHDLQWVIKLRAGLNYFAKKKCQVIAASHHPLFWGNANIIELKRRYKEHALRMFKKNL